MECGATADSESFCNDDCRLSNKASEITTKEKSMKPWEHELCEAVAARSVDTVVSILNEPDRTFSPRIIDDCLLDACGLFKECNQHLVRELLRAGASIKAVSEDGWTPILLAVKEDDFSLICSFLLRGADVNAVTAEGDSALTLSIRPNRSLDIIKLLLLQSGINTNKKNHLGYTALMKAVETRDFEVMKLLIDDHKLNHCMALYDFLQINEQSLDSDTTIINCFGKELFDIARKTGMMKVIKLLHHMQLGQSPLMEAALIPDTELVQILFDFKFYDARSEDSGNITFLQKFFQEKKARYLATGDVDIPVVQLLLESGAAVNGSEKSWPRTEPPLISAVKAGSLGLVQLMCEYGAKVDITAAYLDKSLLDVAAKSGIAGIVMFLLEKQNRVSEQSRKVNNKRSAMQLCLMNEDVVSVENLLKYDYDIDLNINKFLRSGASIKAMSALIAVMIGDFNLLRIILQRGADVNAVTLDGNSALILSIRPNRSLAIIKFLLEQKGIAKSHQNRLGYTALMKAAEARDFEVMKLLIDDYKCNNRETLTICEDNLDSNKTIIKCFGMELFDVATRAGMMKVVKLLLHIRQGQSPLMEAALIPDTELVQILFDFKFYDARSEDSGNTTFLQKFFLEKKARYLATGDVDIPVVQLLLENGAAVNGSEKSWPRTEEPLISAVKAGCLGLVRLMCEYGAKVNNKSSALQLCLMNEDVVSAEIILRYEYQMDLNINKFLRSGASIKAMSALIAVMIGDFNLLRIILQRGADVNAVTPDGNSALILSIRPNRSLAIIKLLLEQKGIVKSHQNRLGYTALMKAVELRDFEVMKLLIDDHKRKNRETLTISKDSLDSDETIINSFGQELFDLATRAGMLKVVKLLLHTEEGESPLMEAALKEDVDLVKTLIDSQLYNVQKKDSDSATFLQNFFRTKKQRYLAIGDADIPIIELLLENGETVNESKKRLTSFEPPVITAVKAGSLGLVQLMCKYGAKLDVTKDSKTPLNLAAESGKADILEYLLSKHDMVSEQSGDVTSKSSALLLCLMNEHVDCAEIILKHGYNIDLDIRRFLPLGASITAVSTLFAVITGDASLLSIFPHEFPDVYAVTTEGDSALTLSVRPNRSLDIIKLLLLQSGIDTNHKNHQGYTALMKAVELRDTEVMKLLIDDHKRKNRETLTISKDSLDSDETIINSFGQEVVDVATRAGMLKVVKLLLHTEEGETPLMEAALRKDVDLVKTLIDSQLYCVQKEDSGVATFLQNFFRTKKRRNLAIGDADIPIIQLLLENGATLNRYERWRISFEPPLITAVKAGSLGLVQLMCKYGANLDVCANNKTPLIVAAESGKADILEYLLSKHDMVSGRGEEIKPEGSALHLSLMNEHTNCAEILMKHGYKIDVLSAAKYAFAYMKPDYLNFLLEKFPSDLSDVKNVLFSNRQKGNHILTEIVKNDWVNIINNLIKIQVHLPDFLLSHSKSAAMVQLLVSCGESVNRRATNTSNPVLLTLILSGNETSVAQIVKTLLENGANVNDCNLYGVTPLIAAAQTWDSSELLNTLLLHGADVHKRDNKGMTAFLYAVEKNHTENAKLLIQLGGPQRVDIELRNTSGSTPLEIATTNNNKTITDLLLNRGANVNVQDQYGDTALTLAAKRGDADTLKKVLERGADINHQNKGGYSALMCAADRYSDICNLDFLLRLHGAKVDIIDNIGNTALLNAVEQESTEITKYLLHHEGNQKIDINTQNNLGSTALIVAVKRRNKAITDLLLARGANVNIEDNSGDTALTLVVRNGDTDTLKKIIERGADINHRNKEGCTALISAIKCKDKTITNLLIDRGANVSVEDNCGDTALTLSIRINDLDTLKKILEKEVDINHQNKKGYSALMIAARNLDKDSIKVLLNAGADVNVVSRGQETKTAISFLVEKKSAYNYDRSTVYILLMDLLLDRGASSSYLKPDALFDLIRSNQLKFVPKLISSGFGPAEIGSEDYLYDRSKRVAFPQLSPFIFALLNSHPKLARYFDGNWFLSTSDVKLQAKHDLFKDILEQRSYDESSDILDEFCSQPMSLLKLSFVVVSSAIGCVPGREERVEKLPLPPIIKDKLLFKKQEVQLDIPESPFPSRESTSSSHAMNLLLGARSLAFPSRRSYWHDDYDYYDYDYDSHNYGYYDNDD